MKNPAMLRIASAVVCAVAAFGVVAQDKKAPAAPAPAAKDTKPAAAPAAPAAPAATEATGGGMHAAMNQGDLKWGDAPPSLPKGAKVAVLNGDPGKAGGFAIMAKFPKGYKVPPHFHSQNENVTVISGTLYMGTGETADKKTGHALKPGGYSYMPAGTRHYAIAESETVIEVAGMGPFDVTYVNPADDPRKAAAAPAAPASAAPKKEEKKK
jgi:quercetin dioxygenase-like cupin family protein